MNQPTLPEADKLNDPRSRHDFQQAFYPSANGKPAPRPDAEARNDRIMLEFLAVYYDLNCAYTKLLKLRQSSSSPEAATAEVDLLRQVEKILIRRDDLEDRYAPFGVLVQPEVKEGFTVDISFRFGNADSRGKPRTDVYRLAAEIPIPLPPGAILEDYIVDFEGPEPFFPNPD
jgi:hypothetical protein